MLHFLHLGLETAVWWGGTTDTYINVYTAANGSVAPIASTQNNGLNESSPRINYVGDVAWTDGVGHLWFKTPTGAAFQVGTLSGAGSWSFGINDDILYTGLDTVNGDTDLFLYKFATGQTINISASAPSGVELSWYQDGVGDIEFTSGFPGSAAGQTQIGDFYVYSADGTVQRLTNNTQDDGNLYAVMTYDGSTIWYRAFDGADYEVFSATRTVSAAVTVTLNADRLTVAQGGSSTLTWSSANATSCTASGTWSGAKAISGSMIVYNPTTNGIYTYTLTCSGVSGSGSKSVAIAVSGIDTTPPSAPVLTGSYSSASGIVSLSYTASVDEATGSGFGQYLLDRCFGTGCAWAGIASMSGLVVSDPLGTVGPASYRVRGCDIAGNCATSNVFSVPVATVTISGNPTSVASGGSSTLTWSSINSASCTASGAWSGTKAVSGSQVISAITATSTYTLTCSGPSSLSASGSVTVTVGALPLPTVTLGASPTSIVYSGPTTLTWTSTNAATCAASGANPLNQWTGAKSTNGSLVLSSVTATGTYTLTCTNTSGSASASTTVTVAPAPTITSFTANPTSVASGGSTTVTWSSANTTACYASGAWSGAKALSGSETLTNRTATGTYTLSCDNNYIGTPNVSVVVSVTAGTAPTLTFSASPTTVAAGTASYLTWSTTNATACTASGGWSGATATSYTNWAVYPAVTTSYTLTCTGAGGSIAKTVTVMESGNTGLRDPGSNLAVTSLAGDNNGFQTNPAYAWQADGFFAVDSSSGTDTSVDCLATTKDKHIMYNYGFVIPSGATIKGIEVVLKAKVDSTSGTPKMCVQLSSDGGVTWSTAAQTKTTAALTTTNTSYTLGGATDTWGRTWTATNLANANFRMRIINIASSTSRTFSLDWPGVRVHY